MASDPTSSLRHALVEQLRRSGAIRSDAVARAFERVPRHEFVPDYPLHLVYGDRALVTRRRGGVGTSSSSQPAIMSVMLEQLRLRRGMNVLEIGAGTGYNAALLAELTGPSGAVSTIDIQAGVAADARRSLRRAGYRDVHVVRTDGARGLRSAAPFDRLIVTAGCWEIPREWLRQLRDGGILVLPLRINLAQVVVAFRKRGDTLATVSAAPGGFMPMEGRAGRRTRRRFGGPHTSLFLSHDYRGRRLREGVLIDLLRTPPRRINMPGLRQVARFPSSADFWVYLALHGLPVVGIGDGMNSQPDAGIADTVEGSLCLLATPGVVRGEAVVYGSSHAPDLLGQHLARWRAEGRPSVTRLRMVVEASNNARLSEIPRPLGEGAYEFGRDGRRFVAWYE